MSRTEATVPMNRVVLGSTGIVSPQDAFGALPIQRISFDEAERLLRRAVDGGMSFFDTARAYSDSEEKMGRALHGLRDRVAIATKTMAKTPEDFWDGLHTSLRNLRTDHVDLYQFHCIDRVWELGDGTGMYECMVEAKRQGKINHIGVTAHKVGTAFEAVETGLYETMQFPFNYLSSPRETELVSACERKNMGFIAMKGLAGGLLMNADALMAHMACFPNALPIWGIQRLEELETWLSYIEEGQPRMSPELAAAIEADRAELAGSFCRGCGYCAPCPQGIVVNQCARMSLMVCRAPSDVWLSEAWQTEMDKIDSCTECRSCVERCPYGLDVPAVLKENLEDYRRLLARRVEAGSAESAVDGRGPA